MVDKVDAKDYVASIIGEQYIIRTLGVWDTVDEISWDVLPNQFVIKSTNDSGGVVVCRDKAKFSMEDAKKKLRNMGGRDYSIISKEYPYKKVPRRFIAEVYIEDESGYELKDYKFFCFDGEVKFLFVATGRQQNDIRFDFYDIEFNHLPVLNGHPNADIWPVKPVNYDEMLDVAAKLSKGIPHVRVDLYNVNGKIYFGGSDGITYFMPEQIIEQPRKNDVYITDFLIFNQPINKNTLSGNKPIISTAVIDANIFRLSHQDNTFCIVFSTLRYDNPQQIKYQYRIKELGEEWQTTEPHAKLE